MFIKSVRNVLNFVKMLDISVCLLSTITTLFVHRATILSEKRACQFYIWENKAKVVAAAYRAVWRNRSTLSEQWTNVITGPLLWRWRGGGNANSQTRIMTNEDIDRDTFYFKHTFLMLKLPSAIITRKSPLSSTYAGRVYY